MGTQHTMGLPVFNNSDFEEDNSFSRLLNIDDACEKVEIPFATNILNLSRICVNDTNEYFASYNWVLFTKDGKSLIRYPSKLEDSVYVVPDWTKELCDSSIANAFKLVELYTGPGVEVIKNKAFAGSRNLVYIDIGKSVSRLTLSAFDDLPKLMAIQVSEDNKHYRTYDGCLYDKKCRTLLRVPLGHRGYVKLPGMCSDIVPGALMGRPSLIVRGGRRNITVREKGIVCK